jgi:hypothetical protein
MKENKKQLSAQVDALVFTAIEIMQAHQFLYYVRCSPILSDYEYDQFCKSNRLNGDGGSDLASDYSPRIVALAEQLKDEPPAK